MEAFDGRHFLDSGAMPENLEREREREYFSSEVDSELNKFECFKRKLKNSVNILGLTLFLSIPVSLMAVPPELGDVLQNGKTACCARSLAGEVSRLRNAAAVMTVLSLVCATAALWLGEVSSEKTCNAALKGFTGDYASLRKSCGIGADGKALSDMSWASIGFTWGVVVFGGLSTLLTSIAKYQIRSSKREGDIS